MARAVSFRLDDESERALRLLEATAMSTSEAIRSALITSADRLRLRRTRAEEVAALERDEVDRAEMQTVAALMESLRVTP